MEFSPLLKRKFPIIRRGQAAAPHWNSSGRSVEQEEVCHGYFS
jgi:hypothetical protein